VRNQKYMKTKNQPHIQMSQLYLSIDIRIKWVNIKQRHFGNWRPDSKEQHHFLCFIYEKVTRTFFAL